MVARDSENLCVYQFFCFCQAKITGGSKGRVQGMFVFRHVLPKSCASILELARYLTPEGSFFLLVGHFFVGRCPYNAAPQPP